MALIKILKYGKIISPTDLDTYTEFTCESDVQDWGSKKFSAWAQKHKDIYNSLSSYKDPFLRLSDPADMYFGSKFREMNAYLRDKSYKITDENIPLYVSALNIAIHSAPLLTDRIILYRKVCNQTIDELIRCNKDSHPYCEKGFMSTSLLKEACINNNGTHANMLKIFVDPIHPIHTIYANSICNRTEAELLLPPDCYISMINYPYEEAGIEIYEVHLYSEVLAGIDLRRLA